MAKTNQTDLRVISKYRALLSKATDLIPQTVSEITTLRPIERDKIYPRISEEESKAILAEIKANREKQTPEERKQREAGIERIKLKYYYENKARSELHKVIVKLEDRNTRAHLIRLAKRTGHDSTLFAAPTNPYSSQWREDVYTLLNQIEAELTAQGTEGKRVSWMTKIKNIVNNRYVSGLTTNALFAAIKAAVKGFFGL
jgi:signal recognition particle subunit SEC65